VRRAARRARRLDRDRGGLSNKRERRLGTDPHKSDSDGDGISDGDEVARKLNPRSRDYLRDLGPLIKELALRARAERDLI
jgi:hypothetical protein